MQLTYRWFTTNSIWLQIIDFVCWGFKNTAFLAPKAIFAHNAARDWCRQTTPLGFWWHYCCVIAANASQANFDLVTDLLVSSVFVLMAIFLNKSWALPFSFNQLLQSRKVGFTQCFWTVRRDHDAFKLGRSFCTAVLRSAALFKSESYEIGLKTPTITLKSWSYYRYCASSMVESCWVCPNEYIQSHLVGKFYVLRISTRLCTLRRSKQTQL